MKPRKFFNLLELSMAVAMSTIGIAAILGMLPLIVGSSKDSKDDTFVSQAAAIAIAELEQYLRNNDADPADFAASLWEKSGETNLIKKTNFYNLQNKFLTATTYNNKVDDAVQGLKDLQSGSYLIEGDLANGDVDIYIGRPSSAPGGKDLTTFSARVVFVRPNNAPALTQAGNLYSKQSNGLARPTLTGDSSSGGSVGRPGMGSSSTAFFSRLYVVVEWPLDVPKARRQKRTFVKEWMSPVFRYPASQTAN